MGWAHLNNSIYDQAQLSLSLFVSAGYWHAKRAEQHTEIYTLPLNSASQNHNPSSPLKKI